MANLKYMLKICYAYNNEIQWMAFYIDGKKKLENFTLDKSVLKKVYKVKSEIRDISLYEEGAPYIYQLFPETEDFSFINE